VLLKAGTAAQQRRPTSGKPEGGPTVKPVRPNLLTIIFAMYIFSISGKIMSNKAYINRNVILTGFTSFCTDVSSEMIYPLLQAFVSTILAARSTLVGPVLGIIEGIAESTASLLKVFSGYYSDRLRKRKAPTISGYGLSAVAKVLLFFASSGWYFVLLSRFIDRIGKGIRTAPRDALISESTPPEMQGRAFGLQRAMDFAGATLGVLILYFLSLKFIDHASGTIKNLSGFYTLFIVSIVPAALGVIFLFFLKETAAAAALPGKQRPKPNLDFRRYDRNLKAFFLVLAIFTLGNSSNQFLLLRSTNVGFALPAAVLMYLTYNLSTTLMSNIFGSLADRFGFKRVLLGGYLLYGIVYAAFGFIGRENAWLLWAFWPLYGVYAAMTEGVEKAFVAKLAPPESKATALGFSSTIVGIGLLPASVIAGLLFSVSPAAPFLFGAVTSIAAIITLAGWVKEKTGR
jgi:MFS family permease